MDKKVVDLKRQPYQPPVSDFWFGQVDHRLSRIEAMVRRLEWQIWLLFWCAVGVLVLELIAALQR